MQRSYDETRKEIIYQTFYYQYREMIRMSDEEVLKLREDMKKHREMNKRMDEQYLKYGGRYLGDY